MTQTPAASMTMQAAPERAVDISRLLDEVSDMWSPLVRRHGAILACEVSTDVPRHVLADVDALGNSLATCMERVLDTCSPASVVHLGLDAENDSDGNLRCIRCVLTTSRTPGEADSAPCSEEFTVPASVDPARVTHEEGFLDGARVLVLAGSNLTGTQMTRLFRGGADVHVTNAPGAVPDILLRAARAGDPFDLCILDSSAPAPVDALVPELRSLPAFTGLPVVVVVPRSRRGQASVSDDCTATCHADADDILECASRVLELPDTAAVAAPTGSVKRGPGKDAPGVWHTRGASRPGGRGAAVSQLR